MKEKQSWVVKMRCVIIKEVICENCSEEDAQNDPWAYAVYDTEKSMEDYEVQKVEPNT